MAFSAKDVAKLREITGAGMMDCKKALTHTDGDMDKAAEFLREQGVTIAAKKASRLASEGAVCAYCSEDGKTGALVEVNCESDFVARGEVFMALCRDIAAEVVKTDPKDLDELLTHEIGGETVLTYVNNTTAKTGEKVSIRRFARHNIAAGREEAYIHMGGKIGVLLEVETGSDLSANEGFKSMCHDIAMHIAAFGPRFVYDSEVPAEEVAHEKEILKTQALNDPKNANKPAQVIDKMIEGRIGKFYKEICLVDQDFAKDPSITVAALVDRTAKETGTKIKIARFTRFVMGEGLEKKNENFAEEIAKMQGGN